MVKGRWVQISKWFVAAPPCGAISRAIALLLLLPTYYFLLTTHFLYSAVRSSTPGTTGASFLKIGISARACGMGEAYTGFSPDASAIEYNPAGIGSIINTEVWFTHLEWFKGTRLESITAASPIGKKFTVGLNYRFLYTRDTERNLRGEELGDFTNYSQAINPAVSYEITRDLFVGVGLKGIFEKLKDNSASAFATDFGFFYKIPWQTASVGISIQNLGTKIKFREIADPLPLRITLGGAYRFGTRLTVSLDISQPRENRLKTRIGIEYQVIEPLKLRAGYKLEEKEIYRYTGISCGFGLRLTGLFYLDYSFAPYADLGLTHRITLGTRFGKKVRDVEIKPKPKETKEEAPKPEKEEDEEEYPEEP